MHYFGLVFTKDPPTESMVEELMEEHKEHFDYFGFGGRFAYKLPVLTPDQESTADAMSLSTEDRQTVATVTETLAPSDSDRDNQSLVGNTIRVRDLPLTLEPYFYVADGLWIPREYFNPHGKKATSTPDRPYSYGKFEETPDWAARFAFAKQSHVAHWVVIIDAHN